MGTHDKEAMPHEITVRDTDNPMYPYEVTCTCNWQALAKTQAQADQHKRMHESRSLWLQATKGWQSGH